MTAPARIPLHEEITIGHKPKMSRPPLFRRYDKPGQAARRAEALELERRRALALNTYLWLRRDEDQIGPVLVPLTMGVYAQIDIQDAPWALLKNWMAQPWPNGKGYYAIDHDGVYMHAYLLPSPAGHITDHRDGDGLNNCRDNLRVGTQALNCVNRQRTPGKHLRGTYPRNSGWVATIKIDGKAKHLGCFKTETEAHQAYLAAASAQYGQWLPENLLLRGEAL